MRNKVRKPQARAAIQRQPLICFLRKMGALDQSGWLFTPERSLECGTGAAKHSLPRM
jgi:hypothetical protein